MSVANHDSILNQALALPERQRLKIAAELLASVRPPGVWNVNDPGFDDELLRRSTEIDDGTAQLSEWPEVRERIRSQLKQRDSQ